MLQRILLCKNQSTHDFSGLECGGNSNFSKTQDCPGPRSRVTVQPHSAATQVTACCSAADKRLPPLRIDGPSTNQIRGIATPDFHGTELQFTTGKQATRAFCKLPTGAVVAPPLSKVDRVNPAALGAKPGETHVCPCCTQSSIRSCGNPTRGPAFLAQDCLDGGGHWLQRQSFNHSLSAVFGHIHVHKNTILTYKGVS